MGLAIRLSKGKSYPELICDHCGKVIDDWNKAFVTYRNVPQGSDIKTVRIYHQGECDSKEREPYSQELRNFLTWLLWNHNWGKKKIGIKGPSLIIGVNKPFDIDEPELLTITEAAEKMHVSRETIYAWIRSSKIKPVKTPGNRLRIPEEQLTIKAKGKEND